MDKKFCAFIFTFALIALSTMVHEEQKLQRSPSVEPVVEVDIENPQTAKTPNAGYDFTKNEHSGARVPANIVPKADATSATSYIGPMIFLITLPFGLWIMVASKFSKKSEDKKLDYYPKTQQFSPFKTEYQKTAEDDDDIDYPKAS